MFDRIVRGPQVALDVEADASPVEVRAAFHALAKQYHPARFGRMSPETQRLANEVFLGIKAAHEALAKQSGWSTRGQPSGSQPPAPGQTNIPGRTQPIPAHQPTGPIPTTQIPRQGSAGITAPTQRPAPLPTPPSGVRITPSPSQPPVQARTQTQPSRPPNPTPAAGRPVTSAIPTTQPAQQTRPITPSPAPVVGRAPTPVPPRAASPVPGTQPPSRTAPATTQPWKPSAPASGPTRSPTASTPAPTQPAAARPAPGQFDERAELMIVMDLVRKGQWPAARAALQNLSSRVPTAQNYKALLAYARGREAQQANRIDDAIQELQRALQLDPNLSLAKTALAELQTKRR